MHAPKTRFGLRLKAVARFLSTAFVIAAVSFTLATSASAHDPGLSSAELQVGSRIRADVTFALSDLQPLLGTAKPTESNLIDIARDALNVVVDDRSISPRQVAVQIDENNSAHLRIEFPQTYGSHLKITSDILDQLSRGHRQYISIRDDSRNLIAERVMDAASNTFEINLSETASAGANRSFRQFLVLGLEHILTGYDHLIFLLGLMIAGAGFKAIARIITSFTVAHSITLAAAALDVVRMPPGVVEPLIAASIIYVGLENIFRRDLKWRWLVTFAFGLVHGFGFASALRELGIGTSGISAAVPLLSFNMGVELGQIMIAIVTLPLIWKLREKPCFALRYAPACSILISLAGTLWLLERTLLK
jgi:hydrogenase/urease accessory protein HupE